MLLRRGDGWESRINIPKVCCIFYQEYCIELSSNIYLKYYLLCRSKRLFFVSTTSTTSTILTGSYCYMSTNAAVVTCKRRRKRNLADEAKISDNSELEISLSAPLTSYLRFCYCNFTVSQARVLVRALDSWDTLTLLTCFIKHISLDTTETSVVLWDG